jgi:hypothetical protein
MGFLQQLQTEGFRQYHRHLAHVRRWRREGIATIDCLIRSLEEDGAI